ncbi:hypothetical protein [uncultured Reyranella sp.]|uniref:hypothetical protein n=1 Tax=uncultured Reyranella sp. TaxID=735512 RepID=UPI0025FEAEC8|nr:hypothetical protein [uncultured Reyranella sp.]
MVSWSLARLGLAAERPNRTGSPRHPSLRMHDAGVPVKIFTIDEASELFGFPDTAEPKGKTAYTLLDTGNFGFISSDESDEWIATGRWELAEEFIFAAIKSGKLRLIGRLASGRNRVGGVVESVELSLIAPGVVRERVIDRWDGELVLVSNHDEADDEGEKEFVDLHIFEEDLLKLAGDLFDYRSDARGDAATSVDHSTYGPPKLVHPATPTVGAETECAQWFRGEVPEVPEKGPGKHAMWDEARKKFGGRLSYRAFSRVWDQLAPPEWKQAGRKPGRRN